MIRGVDFSGPPCRRGEEKRIGKEETRRRRGERRQLKEEKNKRGEKRM